VLSDGIFSYPKSQLEYILESLGLENVGLFYGHVEYFTANRNMLWPFGIFCGHLVHFSVLVRCSKKNLATLASKYDGKQTGFLWTGKIKSKQTIFIARQLVPQRREKNCKGWTDSSVVYRL
jgi:hypothetical protein